MSKPHLSLAATALAVLLACLVALVLVQDATDAAFPGTNGKIFFESTRTGSSQIFSMIPNGDSETNVTRNRSLNHEDPAVSPSGLKIAYEYAREVWVMNTDGSGKRQRTNDENTQDDQPTYSPDGTKITFVSDRDSNAAFPQEIYTMNAPDGSAIRRLTTNVAFDGNPDWQLRP